MAKGNGKQKYLSLGEAGVAFDNGHAQVEICDNALESDFSVRPITPEEKHQISEAADKHSESK